jgi:hypothetical protein
MLATPRPATPDHLTTPPPPLPAQKDRSGTRRPGAPAATRDTLDHHEGQNGQAETDARGSKPNATKTKSIMVLSCGYVTGRGVVGAAA